MDPDATLQLIADAPLNSTEMRVACEALLDWLQRGGFDPDWEANPKGTRRFNKHHGIGPPRPYRP